MTANEAVRIATKACVGRVIPRVGVQGLSLRIDAISVVLSESGELLTAKGIYGEDLKRGRCYNVGLGWESALRELLADCGYLNIEIDELLAGGQGGMSAVGQEPAAPGID